MTPKIPKYLAKKQVKSQIAKVTLHAHKTSSEMLAIAMKRFKTESEIK